MKKRFSKTFALLLATSILAGLLAACGGGGSGSPASSGASQPSGSSPSAATPTGDKPASISLVYQYWDFLPNDAQVFADFAAQFKEKYDIDVVVEGQLNSDQGWQDVLKTQIAAGSGPDVFHMDVNEFSAWKDTVIQPLSPYYEADFWDQFVPNAIDVWNADGKYYAVSNSYSTVGVLYNIDLLAEAGVTMGDSWTLEEFEAAMEKYYDYFSGKTITYTDGSEYPYYVLDTTAAMYYLWLFNSVYGGTPFAETNNMAQAAYVDGLVKLAEWSSKGWLTPSNEIGPGNRSTAFSAGGNVAFQITGDWTATTFYRQDHGIGTEQIPVTTNFSSIPVPVGKDGKPFSEIYNQGVVMNKNLEGWQATAAAELIAFMTTGDAWLAARGPEVGGLGLPARKEWAELYTTTWFDKPEQRAAFVWTAENGTIASPDHQAGGINITTQLQNCIDKMIAAAQPGTAFDEAAMRTLATQALEEEQALINVQLTENEIALDNPDGTVK